MKLGKTLDDEMRDQIAKVISRHLDAFVWSASDMPGIDPELLSHRLAMDPQVKPVRQRRRKFKGKAEESFLFDPRYAEGAPHQHVRGCA